METLTLFDAQDMSRTANQSKDVVIAMLKADGLLAADCDWGDRHALLIHRRGWFGRTLDKVLFKDLAEKDYRLSVVEIKN